MPFCTWIHQLKGRREENICKMFTPWSRYTLFAPQPHLMKRVCGQIVNTPRHIQSRTLHWESSRTNLNSKTLKDEVPDQNKCTSVMYTLHWWECLHCIWPFHLLLIGILFFVSSFVFDGFCSLAAYVFFMTWKCSCYPRLVLAFWFWSSPAKASKALCLSPQTRCRCRTHINFETQCIQCTHHTLVNFWDAFNANWSWSSL